jgi:glycyl-tRNA synthetase beta chain
MSTKDFLVEIGTEELPPKSLNALSKAFTRGILNALDEAGLKYGEVESFASPRRLALLISNLQQQQGDKTVERKGPSVKAAYDSQGKPTRALTGFAQSLGVDASQLEQVETDKGAWLRYCFTEPGKAAHELLIDIVEKSLSALPITKRMRWGNSRIEFVRPVHWVLMLNGEDTIPGELIGVKIGNSTRGHRFHCKEALTISTPSAYKETLLQRGKVVASYSDRRARIKSEILRVAQEADALAVIDDSLLDEVTALNEWPTALVGHFDEEFLKVPKEALISSMKEHQKYFHLLDSKGDILPLFITLTNIESLDPLQVVKGNEKVIRPRLADAAFFYETDKKTSLEQRRQFLKEIVFQSRLGIVYDRTERISNLAGKIAGALGGDANLAERAGMLSKSDLVSDMVLEFTDLQGIMGYYYAVNDGEPNAVALAISDQYKPKFSGDSLPQNLTGCALAIAEKLDSLVGLFSINQPPTGTKDPFALRRAALGVLRIIVEKRLDLDLRQCIEWSLGTYDSSVIEAGNFSSITEKLLDYMLERFRAWYDDQGISPGIFQSVLARRPTRPLDFDKRIQAVRTFWGLDQASALSAANKRVSNILTKLTVTIDSQQLNKDLLTESAEIALAKAVSEKFEDIEPILNLGEYERALVSLAELQEGIDRFFDEVMVMDEDLEIRHNRLLLLGQLRKLFLEVADISMLTQ